MKEEKLEYGELEHAELAILELEQRVLGMIRLMLNTQEIGLNTVLLGKSGLLDSVTAVDLIARLEREFHIAFDEDELWMEALESPRNIIKLIADKRK